MVTGTVNPATLHGTNVSLYFIQATGWNGMVTEQGNKQRYKLRITLQTSTG